MSIPLYGTDDPTRLFLQSYLAQDGNEAIADIGVYGSQHRRDFAQRQVGLHSSRCFKLGFGLGHPSDGTAQALRPWLLPSAQGRPHPCRPPRRR